MENINGLITGPRPPVVGVLTRTLVRSPVLSWIIPARIRHKDKNDVVFIHHNWIEILELSHDDELDTNRLDAVTFKADFGSAIRSARVLGAVRKSAVRVTLDNDGIDAMIKQEALDALRQSATRVELEEEDIDTIIKQEELDFMDISADVSEEIPPQILVLALDSNILVFLFALQNGADDVRFVSCQRPLPVKGRYAEQLGKHIAVDPKSRVLAVAACEGAFTIYALKAMDEMKGEMVSNGILKDDQFMPVKGERHFPLEGVILRMEFLHPPKGGDNDLIILMLVVSVDCRTRLFCYSWASWIDLVHIQPPKIRPVSQDEQLPLLLIPFITSPGFLLVCERVMVTYKNFLTEHPPRMTVLVKPVKEQEEPVEPGNSKRHPLWSHWARPIRHDDYESENESIYLCREDGLVRFLEISADSNISGMARVGTLGINVDSAFASLDFGTGTHDFLGAGGDMSDGGLFNFIPRRNADKMQSIPNWTPILDFVLVRENTSALEHISERSGCESIDRVIAGIGRGSHHGAICELRFGIQAKSSLSFEIQQQFPEGVIRMWAIPGLSARGICALLTDTHQSMAVFIPVDGGDPAGLSEEELGMQYDSRTLSAGRTRNGLIVQITQNSIRAYSRSTSLAYTQRYETDTIIAACIEGSTSAILTAVRKSGQISVQGAMFKISENAISMEIFGNPTILLSEPSVISLERIHHERYAFIGTLDGALMISRATSVRSLIPACSYTFEGEFAICDSIAIIARSRDGGENHDFIVLCGLRNGSLEIFLFQEFGMSEVILIHCQTISMGTTSVTVMPDTTSIEGVIHHCSKAILVCGDSFCRLEYRRNQAQPRSAIINKIWITDCQRPGLSQAPIMAVAQSDTWSHTRLVGYPNGVLLCVESSQLHLLELSKNSEPQALPRFMPLRGTPNRIIHSALLGTLIVGLTKTTVRGSKRMVQPYVSFVSSDPTMPDTSIKEERSSEHDSTELEDNDNGNMLTPNTFKIGRPGERINGLLEWFPSEDARRRYHLLVIATHRAQKESTSTGMLYLYKITKHNETSYSMDLKSTTECASPIAAVAAYGRSSLVYCSGKQLILHTLNLVEKKLEQPISMPLPSLGRHVSVDGSYVHVSTSKHSLLVFRVENDKLVPQFSDDQVRHGLHHLTLPKRSTIIASNVERTIVALWQPPQPQIDNSTSTLFEARFLGSITRLHRGNLRPPWRGSSTPRPQPILGSSADGSFYQIELLDEASWRLLRFLQNMAMRDFLICPFYHGSAHSRHIEPSTEPRLYMQVDGDILLRILERGTPHDTSLLQEMLEREPDHQHRLYDFHTSAARYKRFAELAVNVLGGNAINDPVRATVDYLRLLLEPIM